MIKSFTDKVVLITGGGSGIGLGLATLLVEEGARVALIGTNQEKLDRALSGLQAKGGQSVRCVLDVADPTAWPAVIDHVETALGPIQGLFLNAGIGPANGPVELIQQEQWRWSWDVNLMGVVNGLAAALPAMKARDLEGHVLITSSIAAVSCPPGMGPYATAKAAAVSLAEVLRAELRNAPVGVSVLIPASVNTDMPATSKRHTPAGQPEANYDFMANLLQGGMDPLKVARFVLDHIRDGKFYIFTHPEYKAMLQAKYTELLDSIAESADPEWEVQKPMGGNRPR